MFGPSNRFGVLGKIIGFRIDSLNKCEHQGCVFHTGISHAFMLAFIDSRSIREKGGKAYSFMRNMTSEKHPYFCWRGLVFMKRKLEAEERFRRPGKRFILHFEESPIFFGIILYLTSLSLKSLMASFKDRLSC